MENHHFNRCINYKWAIFHSKLLVYQRVLWLVGGWATPLKNMKVNWDDYSQYMGK